MARGQPMRSKYMVLGPSMSLARPGLFWCWASDLRDGLHIHSVTTMGLINRLIGWAATLGGGHWRVLLQAMAGGHILWEGARSVIHPVEDAQCAQQPNAFLHDGAEAERHVSVWEAQKGLPALVLGHLQPAEQRLAPTPPGSLSRSWSWPAFVVNQEHQLPRTQGQDLVLLAEPKRSWACWGYCLKCWEMPGAQPTCSTHTLAPSRRALLLSQPQHPSPQEGPPRKAGRMLPQYQEG